MNKRRTIIWIIIILLLCWDLLLISGEASSGQIPLYDFIEYWSAGRVLLSGGDPYSNTEMLGAQRSLGWKRQEPLMMWNPPWTFIFVLPFAFMPYWAARWAWFLAHGTILVCVSDFVWRWFGGPRERRWIAWLASILFLPCTMALYLGQISPLVLGGMIGFLWAAERRREIAAGLLTLPIAVKPHLLYIFWFLLLLWIWQDRRWRVLAGVGLSLIASLLPVLFLNRWAVWDYFGSLTSAGGPLLWMTPSLGSALLKLISPKMAWLRFLPMMLGTVWALWLCWRWRPDFRWRQHWLLILLASTVTTSFCWTFDWVVLLPIVMLMLIWIQDRPARNWWLLAALVLLEVGPVLMRYLIPSYNDFYALWLPSFLWLIYWLGGRRQMAGRCVRADGTA